MAIPFPTNVSELANYLFRKGDYIYKPYDLIIGQDSSFSLICGRVNMSSEILTENNIFDKTIIPLADFINPEQGYITLGDYSFLKNLLDEAQLNNSRTFFSGMFTQFEPQNIAELNSSLNPPSETEGA